MDNIIKGSPLGPRVTAAIPTDDYRLLLTFTNGEQRIFDAKFLLEMDAFKPLNNKLFFRTVKVAYGSILWPCDIDYCPDTLYKESQPIGSVMPNVG